MRTLKGKYTQAEPLYRRAIVIYEKKFGKSHPKLAVTLNNLGELYRRREAPNYFTRMLFEPVPDLRDRDRALSDPGGTTH